MQEKLLIKEILCKIFVDLQKAFDTVDHQIIILTKLNHYGIRGVSNFQFVSINGYDSGLAAINCGAFQRSRTTSIFAIYK